MSGLLHELAAGWSAWAWPRALQFGAAALLLLAAERCLLRRAWPRLRLALHSILLLGLVLPGSIAAPWSVKALLAASTMPVTPALPEIAGSVDAAAPGATLDRLLAGGFAIWAVVAAALLLGSIVRHRRVRAALRARDAGAPAWLRERVTALSRRIGLRRAPEIVVGTGAAGPAVLGGRRSLLLIPSVLAEPSAASSLDLALVHELLHLRRGDLWLAAASRVVASLWWFHPLAWLVARRAATLREICCDDDAVRWLDGRAAEYQATLLDHARRLLAEPPPAGALGFFTAPSSILARLEWLARPRAPRPRLERGAASAAAVALALLVWPSAAPAAEREAARATELPRADPRLHAAALEVVKAALGSERPPGCLSLHHAVNYLAAAEAASPSP